MVDGVPAQLRMRVRRHTGRPAPSALLLLFLLRPQSVVLMSHLGRPDGTPNKKYTLAPCVDVVKVRSASQPAAWT
jgi:hypothetical protein